MVRKITLILSLTLLLAMVSAGCGGGSSPNPPVDRVTGVVLDSDGVPMQGLSLLVNGSDSQLTTNAQGRFEVAASLLEDLSEQNEISFGMSGVVVHTEQFVPAVKNDIEVSIEPSVEGNGSLEVKVFDEVSFEPLTDANLILFASELGLYQGATDSSGAYLFEDVPAGQWVLLAEMDEYSPEVLGVNIGENGMSYQGVALQPTGTPHYGEGVLVSGVITEEDSSSPVEGAYVSMTVDTGYIGIYEEPMPMMDFGMPERYAPQYFETFTDASGAFSFETPVEGYSLYMSYYKDGYIGGSHWQEITGDDDINLDLTMKALTMTSASGRVVDENGDPVEGAYVEFVFSGMSGGYLEDTIALPGDPMWDGMEQAANMMTDAPLGGGDSNNTGDGPDNSLMQRYRWENRNSERDTSMLYIEGYYWTNTDANGDFSFDELPAGSYWVFLDAYRHTSYWGEEQLEESTSANTFDYVLENIPVGGVEGYIRDENGNPVEDVLVTCVQPNIDPFAYTDANGYYYIGNVPEGDWVVTGYLYGYISSAANIDIVEDTTARVDLTITSYTPPVYDTLTVTGRTLDGAEGVGVEGARMIFTRTDDSYYYDSTAGEDGIYSAELVEGEYNLLIQADGYEDLYIRWWISSQWTEIDFTIWPIGSSGGRWGGGWGMFDGLEVPAGGGSGDPQNFDPDDVFEDWR